jgi:hypothetical protein
MFRLICFSLGLAVLFGCNDGRTTARPSLDAHEVSDTGFSPDVPADVFDAAMQVTDSGAASDLGFRADAMFPNDSSIFADSSVDAGHVPDSGNRACGCAANEYCEFSSRFSCNEPGTCRIRPEACTFLYDPVCGCDKMDYGNECAAHSGGVDISHEGVCDCRDLGCATGQSCQLCRTQTGAAYVCLPQGAVC